MKTQNDKKTQSFLDEMTTLINDFDWQEITINTIANDFYNLVNSKININRNALYEMVSVCGDWAKYNLCLQSRSNEFEMF
jgi:hypothetical protein